MLFLQYLKQTFSQLRSQSVLSGIQILGTALAIFMIMVYVMMRDINVESFPPETHRDRYLHVPYMSVCPKDSTQDWSNNSCLNSYLFRQAFKEMETPEAVACYTTNLFPNNVGIVKGVQMTAQVKYCSDQFWRVFDFDFTYGRPFNEAECESSLHVAVITESVANQLFGTTKVDGKDIVINKTNYRVTGVVKNTSPLATKSYAEIWIPYSIAEKGIAWNQPNEALGNFSVIILAHSRDDFPKIRQECETLKLKFDESWSKDVMTNYRGKPYDQETCSIPFFPYQEPDMDGFLKIRIITIFIFLLVPAINLSSMTQSRFRQRMIEIGVRRSFGSTKGSILNQVFCENLILTLMSGFVGLIFCLLLSRFGSDILFSSSYTAHFNGGTPITVDMSMLMHVSTFIWAFLFCFLLNLMSSMYPAWKASRTNIINALKGH